MRALYKSVEAELLSPHDEVDIVRETGAHVLTRGMLAANDQAQFHSCLHFGARDIVFRSSRMQARSIRIKGRVMR